jgi:Trk-type K+ transport system membrane component
MDPNSSSSNSSSNSSNLNKTESNIYNIIGIIVTIIFGLLCIGISLILPILMIKNCEYLVDFYEYKKELLKELENKTDISNKTEQEIKELEQQIDELKKSGKTDKIRQNLGLFAKYFIIVYIIIIFLIVSIIIYNYSKPIDDDYIITYFYRYFAI